MLYVTSRAIGCLIMRCVRAFERNTAERRAAIQSMLQNPKPQRKR